MMATFTVHGRVQGVGFRYFVLQRARNLQLAGWVSNAWDRTVTGEAGGEPSLLEALREELAAGPPSAYVSRLDWNLTEGGECLPLPFTIR